jgi:GGDEF domain-containing protein
MQKTLAGTAELLANICFSDDEHVERLGEIEEQIEQSTTIQSVRAMKFKLVECLQLVRETTLRQRDQLGRSLTLLRERLAGVQDLQIAAGFECEPTLDDLTGLPFRWAAESAFADAIERGGTEYATVFLVSQLHLVNARFGYATGDRILLRVGNHLVEKLPAQSRLFRWTGPAFVALMTRSEPLGDVEEEIRRITGVRIETDVQIGNGSVLLPAVLNSLVVPLASVSSAHELTSAIDGFVSEASRR